MAEPVLNSYAGFVMDVIHPGARQAICDQIIHRITAEVTRKYKPLNEAAETKAEKDALAAARPAEIEQKTKPYRSDPLREGLCEKCGYSLFNLTVLRCPECGTPFDPAALGNTNPPSAIPPDASTLF